MGHGWWMVAETLFWLALIVFAIWLAVSLTASSVPASGGSSPVEILEQRFARGEVTSEDFEVQPRAIIDRHERR